MEGNNNNNNNNNNNLEDVFTVLDGFGTGFDLMSLIDWSVCIHCGM